MADKFRQWDAFMREVARSETVEDGFLRYERKRRRQGTMPKKKPSPLEKAKARWAARHEQQRVTCLEQWARKCARESLLRAGGASKNTT